MSDAASFNQRGLSSELLRGLRPLVLPLWARVVIFGLMIVVVVGGLTMLAYGLWAQKDGMASRAMLLITLSLPVLAVVLALVFGQNSDAKLLGKDFPRPLGPQLQCADACDCLARILHRSPPQDFLPERAQRLDFIQYLSFWMDGVWHALQMKATRT